MATHETTCCIVGGGPGGVVLAYLLARRGIPVTLLEAHHDFDRDFRGDTLHPSAMEVLDQLGLADRLLELGPAKMRSLTLMTAEGPFQAINLSYLKTKFPFVTMMPQVRFLEFMAEESKQYPEYDLRMGCSAHDLIEEDGEVRGVRYKDSERNEHEIRAVLTVGVDGRFSKLRKLAGFEVKPNAPPMDVLWFRLPREQGDVEDAGGGVIGSGKMLITLNRADEWQIGYVFPKGRFQKLKAQGLEAFQQSIVKLAPWFGDRVKTIQSWSDVSLLSVASSRLSRWYRGGLLLIGDAAHVMSPVGGVGINYAMMDAVETANVLGESLAQGKVSIRELAEVQKRRMFATKFIQWFQRLLQQNIISEALQSKEVFRLPWIARIMLKIPFLRALPARIVGFGVNRAKVENLSSYR